MINRKSLIENLQSALHKGNYVVCICPERSGLSTVLKQLGTYIVSGSDDRQYSLINIDELGTTNKNKFCKSFGDHLCSAEPRLSKYLTAKKSIFECLVNLGINSPFSTIIAVDNFHKLPISSQKEFLVTSRRFHTERHKDPSYKKVLLIIGGVIDLHACEPDSTSPYNIADRIYPVEFDFSPNEVSDYLNQELSGANLYIDEITLNYICDLTRGQIYFLEKLCKKLIKRLQKDRLKQVTMDEINNIVGTLFDDKDIYLDRLLENIKNLETDTKLVLSEILAGKRHKFSRSILYIRSLELLGLIREEHYFTSIRSPILEVLLRDSNLNFLPPVAPKELVMPRIVGGNTRAYQILFELENDLRNFVISKLYGEYKSHWIHHTPKSKGWNQAKVRHNIAKNDSWKGQISCPLMAYLFFSDLKEVIAENWNIFDNFQPQDKFFRYFDRLEEIRNEVAHNRLLSHQSLNELENIRDAFRNSQYLNEDN